MPVSNKPQPLEEISGMPAPGGHYSHAIAVNGMLYISGQLPITEPGGKLAAAPFEQQARQVLQNISAILRAGGAEVSDLVQVRIYLDDVENWPRFNDIYAGWIGAWRPARAVIPVGTLHHGLSIEIEAVAIHRRSHPD